MYLFSAIDLLLFSFIVFLFTVTVFIIFTGVIQYNSSQFIEKLKAELLLEICLDGDNIKSVSDKIHRKRNLFSVGICSSYSVLPKFFT